MAEMQITRNERVLDAKGTEVGRVIHVIVDGTSRQVTDLVMERDGNETTVPLASVTRSKGNTLTLIGSAAQMMKGAMFDRASYHEVEERDVESMPMRQAGGGATLENVTKDSATIAEMGGTSPQATTPVARTAPHPAPVTPTRAATQQTDNRTVREGEEISVPVVEEQLTAGVREREAGRFHLVKTVTEEQQSIDVPLQHDEVYITQTTTNRPATEADLAALDRDIEVPMRSQEAVVSKEAVVTGEVGIRKETVTETQRVSDTVRREEVHVEGTDGARIHREGEINTSKGKTTKR